MTYENFEIEFRGKMKIFTFTDEIYFSFCLLLFFSYYSLIGMSKIYIKISDWRVLLIFQAILQQKHPCLNNRVCQIRQNIWKIFFLKVVIGG